MWLAPMGKPAKKLTPRQTAILAGLFLSKFDREGIKFLGFQSRDELCNVIGLALNVKPRSIRNYRDDMDPKFPNPRKGRERPMRRGIEAIYNDYRDHNMDELAGILKAAVYKNPDIDLPLDEIAQQDDGESYSFARRLITGQAAEEYFRRNHSVFPAFSGMQIEDKTLAGCGFDFQLTSASAVCAVEVKGIRENSGGIMLTNKEKVVASSMGDDYFLFVVKNLQEAPSHIVFQNPIESELQFRRTEQKVVRVGWTTHIK